jgi:hypothetical protein
LKILPVTCFKDRSSDFDNENAYRKPPVIVKSYRKPPVTNSLQPMRGRHQRVENIDQSQWSVAVRFSKLVSNFKESNKKLIIV